MLEAKFRLYLSNISVERAKTRQQCGQPIAKFQALQWMMADMAIGIDAVRLLAYRAAYLEDKGVGFISTVIVASSS